MVRRQFKQSYNDYAEMAARVKRYGNMWFVKHGIDHVFCNVWYGRETFNLKETTREQFALYILLVGEELYYDL